MSTDTTPPSPAPAKPEKTYKDTLNLPNTAFPMEAKLVTREPERLAKWNAANLYAAIQHSRKDATPWILHDGPPFANGDIHIGHVVNKSLKDVFLRYKTMAGFRTPYVPGWDCHGLPIEHKVQQDVGPKIREMSTVEVRQKCFAHAQKYVDLQSAQFQRLGILGDWAHPYLTMAPQYEADTLEVFAKFVEAGLVYKQLKPVQWSIANQTALADAELEYQDVEDTSVYVEFPAANPGKLKGDFNLRVNAPVSILIWTTTPWTLPANLAVTVGPAVDYVFVQYERDGRTRVSLLAEALVEKVLKTKGGVEHWDVLARATGEQLVAAGVTYTHPFIDRQGRLFAADYVTTTDGTGLVHTAPGHGEEDYETGVKNGLEVYCPVLANGRYDTTVPEWLQGKVVWEGNTLVLEKLKQTGHLFAEEKYTHPYPHDWRSKTKTIFRATEQWFISVEKPYTPAKAHGQDARATAVAASSVPRSTGILPVSDATLSSGSASTTRVTGVSPVLAATQPSSSPPAESLRARCLQAIDTEVSFIPTWGQSRIKGMLDSRPDWCISRQRAWGLPIPVFYNEQGEPLLTPESVRAVAERFRAVGSDAWFNETPEQLLAGYDPGPNFPKDKLRKEKDIFDVWFESGSSWNSVLRAREPDLRYPADLYLEGSDQHRGWFQLSLLPSLGTMGVPPYKQVLTHGFIVKPDGTKVSKSDKEYVKAVDEINRHGADLLRLWTCSLDYQGDMPASPKALQDFADKYRKIRNTLKYLLSNLYDFNPEKDTVKDIPQASLDGWALAQTDDLVREVTNAYEEYSTHRAFRLLHDFCSVQISSVYANAMKDRLYCDAPNSPLRRRCQTVLLRMADVLTKLLAPMLVFTADEAWEYLPRLGADKSLSSVHLAYLPQPLAPAPSDAQRAQWKLLLDLRDAALMQLDGLKKSAGLNKAVEAEVIYHLDPATRAQLAPYGVDLEDLIGVGSYELVDAAAPKVEVLDRRQTYPQCARSWKRRKDVGSDPSYPDLSARDAAAVRTVRG
jgi:isoleucyl-tRNA synthetase